jgi:hypothetical protein
MRRILLALLLVCASLSSACERSADLAATRGAARRQLVLTPPVVLQDAAGKLLARPDVASEDPAGRIVVTVVSDRNI